MKHIQSSLDDKILSHLTLALISNYQKSYPKIINNNNQIELSLRDNNSQKFADILTDDNPLIPEKNK